MNVRTHSKTTFASLVAAALMAAVAGACLLAGTPAPAGAALRAAGAGVAPAHVDGVASLQDLQSEARRTRAQMQHLDAEQEVITQKWEEARRYLDKVNADLVAARLSLSRARNELERQRTLVAGRMKTMYKAGDYTWLDIVTSATSLAEAETVLDFLRRISLQDRHEETDLQELTGKARKLEHDVEAERKKAVTAQVELDDQRAALDAKVAQRAEVLKTLVTRIKKILSAPLLLMKSGGKVTQITWAQALIKSLGMPMTADNVAAVVAWEMAEGGHWYNTAYYNPLNTTQSMPGATVFNSVGVKAYTSWAQGLKATVITMHNGYYGGILEALSGGNDAQAVADAVAASPWGTGSFSPRQ
jgi:peptidoglycan hydrolase CwlO-like protein